MTLNSAGNSGGNGANSFTINSAGGLWLGANSTNSVSMATTGVMTFYNQTTSGSTNAAVCVASGATGTGGGQVILVTGAAATCVSASALEFKNPETFVTAEQASLGLDAFRQAPVWTYKDQQRFDDRIHVGLYADDVEKMDARCVLYNKETGRVKDYDDRCLIAYLVAARAHDRQEFEAFKRTFLAPTNSFTLPYNFNPADVLLTRNN